MKRLIFSLILTAVIGFAYSAIARTPPATVSRGDVPVRSTIAVTNSTQALPPGYTFAIYTVTNKVFIGRPNIAGTGTNWMFWYATTF